jgi:prophage regulatory protein
MAKAAALQLQKVIMLRDLTAVTGLRKTQIAKKVANGTFPKPIQLSERRKAWLEAEVAAWQIAAIRNRDDSGE